jgi:eukaryotic-like serine/threonine-protein kinase
MSDWNLIESVLDTVLLLPEDERDAYLDQHYGDQTTLTADVRELLRAIQSSDRFFETADMAKEHALSQFGDARTDDGHHDRLIGETIGKYRIEKLIDHGGMGTVYLAGRCDGVYEQKVALKLIRSGMDTPENVARFERERYILAGLSHPNIAGLIDGGVTDFGLPYLVMEYVDGRPIHTYCDEERLSVHERIRLFQTICDALQYAHNNLVIHRDLKPANILVDHTGTVKILDFGIAKLIQQGITGADQQTKTSHQVLTPCCAAPEQITGDPVTTSSDTYALGVLLYRLMSGIKPFRLNGTSMAQQQQVITQVTPESPSAAFLRLTSEQREKQAEVRQSAPRKLATLLRRDLDAVIMKSIRKEPDMRYQTPSELSSDLVRFLHDRPVQAHHGNLRYKTSKFIRRNGRIFAASGLLLLILLSFSVYHTNRIAEERNQAQHEARKASQVTSLLYDLFEVNDPGETLGETITARELLDRGVRRAELLSEQPELQAQMFNVIGEVHTRLGNFERARNLLENASGIYMDLYGSDHPETYVNMASLGNLSTIEGDYRVSRELLTEALTGLKRHNYSDVSSLASIISDLAYSKRRQGDFRDSEKLFRDAFEMLNEEYGPEHIQTIYVQNSLGTILFNTGQYTEAEQIYRETLDKRLELLGARHPDVAESKNSLAALMMNLGRFEEALELYTEAFDIRYSALGPDHPRTLLTMNNMGILYRDTGQFDRSEEMFSRVLEIREEKMGPEHVSTAITYFSIGELYFMNGNPVKSRQYLNKALPVFEAAFTENHSFTVRTRMNIGYTWLLEGDPDEAERYMPGSYDKITEVHPEHSLERALADHQIGIFYKKTGNLLRADSLLYAADRSMNELEHTQSERRSIILKDLEKVRENLEERVSDYPSASL